MLTFDCETLDYAKLWTNKQTKKQKRDLDAEPHVSFHVVNYYVYVDTNNCQKKAAQAM